MVFYTIIYIERVFRGLLYSLWQCILHVGNLPFQLSQAWYDLLFHRAVAVVHEPERYDYDRRQTIAAVAWVWAAQDRTNKSFMEAVQGYWSKVEGPTRGRGLQNISMRRRNPRSGDWSAIAAVVAPRQQVVVVAPRHETLDAIEAAEAAALAEEEAAQAVEAPAATNGGGGDGGESRSSRKRRNRRARREEAAAAGGSGRR